MNSAGRPRPLTPARDSIRRVDAGACREGRAEPVKRASFDPSFTGAVAVFEDGWHGHGLKRCQALGGPEHDGAGRPIATIIAMHVRNSAPPDHCNRVATSSSGATASVAPTASSMYRFSTRLLKSRRLRVVGSVR